MKRIIFAILLTSLFSACNRPPKTPLAQDIPTELDAWKDTPDQDTIPIIKSIVNYVQLVTDPSDQNSSNFIPKEDRIAVFDMDGTIACERPHSMELICAYTMVFHSSPECGDSIKKKLLAKYDSIKPANSDLLIAGFKINADTIHNRCIPTKGTPQQRTLSSQFFKPMVQLIKYLKRYDFDVYVVSGSSQQFIWAVIEDVKELNFERSHLIGSIATCDSIGYTSGKGVTFMVNGTNYWTDSGRDKAISIYNRIGKIPVFAFGNTVHDFDMFALTSSNSKYKTFCALLNHNDSTYEDQYEPFLPDSLIKHDWKSYPNDTDRWGDAIFDTIMNQHNWIKVNLSKNFKKEHVFIAKN